MVLQDDIASFNKLFKEYDTWDQLNRMHKLLEKTAPHLAISTLAKELPSLYERYEGLLAPILPMREQISQLNTLYELANPFKSILDNSILGYSNINNLINEITIVSPALSILNQCFNSYDDVILKQEKAFSQIPYFRPSEKRMLLRHEKTQKDSLVLGSEDLENTDVINSNVTNTIGFINSIAQIDNQDIDNASLAENLEKELYELLSSHGEGYLEILKGAKQASRSDNPDKVRHTVTSLRELSTHILHDLSPDEKVKRWSSKKEDFFNGRPTRKCRVAYIFRNLEHSRVSHLIDNDIKFIVDFFYFFNKGTHELIPMLDIEELGYLINKMESTLFLLLKYSFKE